MIDRLKILIIGGYGTFGGRIVELLENEPRLTLIVAGRSLKKAVAFCHARRDARAQLIPAAFDRDSDLKTQIASLRPDILVDASGPFQTYGNEPYRVIKACIEEGVNYLDLADGSDFVAGVRAFDQAARAADRYVLSGVSSFPVLTAAVVRHLSSGMARLDAIRGGIAPSPYAGVGENVIRAIAGYAGRPVSLKRNGETAVGYPFTEHVRFTIAPPGYLPLRNTLFSLVDVPDLRALAELWPDAKSIWMGAGPVPEILHHVLAALAWLVRFRLIPSLSVLAPLMYFATNHLRWGEHRGGMFVVVEGTDASGAPLKRSWHLLAEGDDGPRIPSMAVEALVRRILEGISPAPGARAAVKDLELDDYEKLFTNRTIYAGTRDDARANNTPLYARLLGTAWDRLPAEIRHLHNIGIISSARGRASVERGRGVLSRLVAAVIGFPSPAVDTPVNVRLAASGDAEIWTRTFGNKSFSSHQFAGRGRSEGLLCERFGPLTFAMALVPEGGRLSLVLRRWSAFGIPLPMWLCPRSASYEETEGGRFVFNVEIKHPFTGLIVRYRGWLEPDQPSRDNGVLRQIRSAQSCMNESIDREFGRRAFGLDPLSYHTARPPYPDWVFEILRERCGLAPNTATFEIGAGTGKATGRLLELGAKPLTAVESDPRMAAFLRETVDDDALTIMPCAFEDAVLQKASFDLGISATAFHWLHEAQALAKVATLLRPGGWWAMVWNVFGDPNLADPFHEATRLLLDGPKSPSAGTGQQPFALDAEARFAALEQTRSFASIEHRTRSWPLVLDADQTVALYATYSNINIRRDREAVLAELHRIARDQFHNRVTRNMVTSLYIAQRRR